MHRVLIIGESKQAYDITKSLVSLPNINIVGIVATHLSTPFQHLTNENDIIVAPSKTYFKHEPLDLIIETTESKFTTKKIQKIFRSEPVIMTKPLTDLLIPFLRAQFFENDNLRLILNTIRDGLIVVDRRGYIRFMNETALRIINVDEQALMKHVTEVIPHTRLPIVLKTRQKEVNKRFSLHNQQSIVTTRIPLINDQHRLVGAFAIFKDTNEIIHLAEENTDLKKIKTMLEAIIYASEEAISVVDEKGKGLMINPAYTRITGLTEADVLGKPASVDIAEGESIHMEVLRTRRPIRGAKLKVGPANKEVFVNVAPVIVGGKLKGSIAVIHDISNIERLTTELKRAKQMIRELEASYTFDDIIGESEEIHLAIEQAKMAAKTPATVLLRGDSGTGKELFAHAIHNKSDRKHHQFIRVNCAALADSVLESELFGYEGGAFTGAKSKGKKGLFEVANNGSVFLDEIGELSLRTQAKLLRVLQEKEIVRVGGTTPISINVRIIAATNANLEKKISDGSFRKDLYYRLNRLPIYIPSLKERMEDLPSLVHFIIAKVNQLYGRTVQSISSAAINQLTNYHWPGNVRELENIISRAIIFMKMNDKTIEAHHIGTLTSDKRSKDNSMPEEPSVNGSLREALDHYEKQLIKKVYKANNYNKTKTAKELEISIRSLYYKLEKFAIQ